jgi:hypothetical protein
MAVAQLLNWQVLGLDGWWLLLFGGWLLWLPPELLRSGMQRLQGAVPRGWSSCARGLERALAASQQQPQQPAVRVAEPVPLCAHAMDIALVEIRSGARSSRVDTVRAVEGWAWSSWFWEGSGRQRRLATAQLQQQPEETQATFQPGAIMHQSGRASRADGGARSGSNADSKPPDAALTLRAWLLVLVCIYHVVTPLRFLAYPSRWVGCPLLHSTFVNCTLPYATSFALSRICG